MKFILHQNNSTMLRSQFSTSSLKDDLSQSFFRSVTVEDPVIALIKKSSLRLVGLLQFCACQAENNKTNWHKQNNVSCPLNQFYTSNNFSFYLKGLLYLFSCSPPRLRAEVCRKDEIYYWKYILQTEAINCQLNYCKMDRPVIILHLLKYNQIKSHESSFTKIHLNWDWTTTINKK